MKHFLSFICSLISVTVVAQPEVPQDYFSSPLDIPIILSGSFGELRSNHFHGGLDIKTQQRQGLPIYAPADGYVSRIKVAHFGYGKALYLTHPNGYITVYAHLKDYAGAIQEYVKRFQYRKESYQVEMFPEPGQLQVRKGELIGYTGNSGSSGGPHLHFEIRDAQERPMNPMLFGIEVPDDRRPLINSVLAYPLDGASINGRNRPVKLNLRRQSDGNYVADPVSISGKVGFGISAYDQQNGASNKNGIYRLLTRLNGQQIFDVLFDRFSFAETRYINGYIDYTYFKRNKSRVQRLYRAAANPLSLLKTQDRDGTVELEAGLGGVYQIEVVDFKDNRVLITIPLNGVAPEPIEDVTDPTDDAEQIIAELGTALTKGKFNIYFPAHSVYENTWMEISAQGDTLHLHKDEIPLHKSVQVSMDVSDFKSEDREKLFIGRLNYRGKPYYQSTELKEDRLTIYTRTLGKYTVVRDDSPPAINPVNFRDQAWISRNKTLQVKIKDGLSGIGSYKATINGKFALMEYEYKKDLLTFELSDLKDEPTELRFELTVVDNVGNSATFEATIFRKQQ
jgi:hypothetical protein